MRKIICIGLILFLGSIIGLFAQNKSHKLKLGYALSIAKITDEKVQYIKSLGFDHIELSGMGALLDKDLTSTGVDVKWEVRFREIARILKRHDVQVWSVHMPFSRLLDLSLIDEKNRLAVIQAHKNVLKVLKPVGAKIILFHPSYYLGLNERAQRASQLTKSVAALNSLVKEAGSVMVVENMLGPELRKGDLERPLMRTVQECKTIFKTFPEDVGIAVDMCHISNPEELLLAFGSRVKTLHVANGTGKAEDHFLPCDPRGHNDWNKIFSALAQIGYQGVFMHECKFNDEKEIVDCYESLWNDYQTSLTFNTQK